MAKVHILNVTVHNNPAPFFTPFQFEIHFECLEKLQDGMFFIVVVVDFVLFINEIFLNFI